MFGKPSFQCKVNNLLLDLAAVPHQWKRSPNRKNRILFPHKRSARTLGSTSRGNVCSKKRNFVQFPLPPLIHESNHGTTQKGPGSGWGSGTELLEKGRNRMSCPPDFQSRAVGVDAANQTLSHRPECQASETGALGPLILRCQWFCGTFYWLRSDEVAPRYHIGGKRVKAGRTVFPFYHQHGLWETWVNMSWL